MSKVLVVISALFLFTACSSTGSGFFGSSSTSSASDKFRIAGEGLEVFEPIEGSETGARAGDRVFFAFDSAVLTSSEQETLDRQAEWLKENADVNIMVEGHCDERGTREYNLALGERRAAAVKAYLVSSGVSANRISTVSYGKERPAVLGSGSAAHAENRRSVSVIR